MIIPNPFELNNLFTWGVQNLKSRPDLLPLGAPARTRTRTVPLTPKASGTTRWTGPGGLRAFVGVQAVRGQWGQWGQWDETLLEG